MEEHTKVRENHQYILLCISKTTYVFPLHDSVYICVIYIYKLVAFPNYLVSKTIYSIELLTDYCSWLGHSTDSSSRQGWLAPMILINDMNGEFLFDC